MKKILLISFILGVSLFVLCSCGKKENVIGDYAPEEEMSIITGEDDPTSIADGKDLEDETVKELTMEALLELYENDGLKMSL